MGCGSSLVKYFLFFTNLVFALAGLALLIVGVLYKLDVTEFTDALPKAYQQLGVIPTLLIVIGSIVFVIAFFGCCGAVKESTCMLTTYAIILLVIFILQIALGVYAFLQINNESDLKSEFRKSLQDTFNRYSQNELSTETIDGIQQRFECCGMDSPNSSNWPNNVFPASCCSNNATPCTNTFSRGCFGVVYDKFIEIAKVIGIVVVSVAAVEIFGAVFALCLASSIRNQYRRGAYA